MVCLDFNSHEHSLLRVAYSRINITKTYSISKCKVNAESNLKSKAALLHVTVGWLLKYSLTWPDRYFFLFVGAANPHVTKRKNSGLVTRDRGVSNRAKWCPRFQDLRDLRISMGFQYFIGISRSHMDFKISMRFHRISMRFHRISLRFCKIS